MIDICAKVIIDIDIDDCACACKKGKDCSVNLIEILVKLLLKLSSCSDDERDLIDICILIQLDNLLKNHHGEDIPLLLKLVVDLAAKLIIRLKIGLP